MKDEDEFDQRFGHGSSRPRTSGGRGPPRRPAKITAATLRDLKREDPSAILTRLARPNSGLIEFIKRADVGVEAIKLLVEVLGKACLCESMQECLNSMLVEIQMTNFLDTTLSQLLLQACRGRNGDDEILKSILPLLKTLVAKMPTEGCTKVQLLAVALENLWQKGGMTNEDINHGMTELMDLLHRSQPPPQQTVQTEAEQVRNDEVPESFRELPIIPRNDELDGTVEVFLLQNRIDGGFRDLEHYLECQFRLFRADVIMPLKESIIDYQTVGNDTSIGYRIYTDVRIVRPVCSHNGLGYRIAFDTRPLGHVKWESSRRLIFGSLLCLSSDNFKTNMLFATVDQRDKALLKNGLVDVQFLSEPGQIADISRDTQFAMVESQAYFESYKYVLGGMQRLTERNFPFQRYLVECQNDVAKPRYLQQAPDFKYDLRPLLDDNFRIRDSTRSPDDHEFPPGSEIANNVKIQDDSSWPIPDVLNLDHSQMIALKDALTKEFALIQGPPGTGKTYVGVKILKALLHNSAVWRQEQRHLPVLIVCYTNHALDQFLEATLQFFDGDLVRVGTRSKSERLQEHSLKNAKQRAKELRSFPQHVHAGKLETLRAMDSLKADIHTTATRLEVAEMEIVHEKCLKEFMSGDISAQFPPVSDYQPCHILHWLGIQREIFKIEQNGEYLQHQLEERGYDEEDNEEEYEDEETIDLTPNRQSLRELDDDLDVEIDDFVERGKSLDANIQRVRKDTIGLDISNFDVANDSSYLPKALKDVLQEQQKQKRKLKRILIKQIRSVDRMTQAEVNRVNNIWRLHHRVRWRLYRYWVDQLCRQAKGEIRDKEKEYESLAGRYRDILLQEDRAILQNCSIIGMTTTAAAKYQQILNEIGPKIIVVEEAAEVLEAHVIGTLSRECQHLILIGDHMQLRPNPTVHKLAKTYGLEVSLFERMVRNKLKCNTLLWQHRMRPEIADVIRNIYPKLKDHSVVNQYANVKGLSRNIFFIDHSKPHVKDDETKSFMNEHEAQYMIALCKYLIKQGYSPDKITILTTYSAQMHYLKGKMPKSQFEGVKVVAVDSYQGEENDIVLLSLVRSGEETSIGFLGEDNRVCVALSRAKVGLYVIGNLSYITDYSPLMKKICTAAKQRGYLGPALPLSCPNHPGDNGILAMEPRDFERVPEGGCTKPCEYRLRCGHVCPKMCHANDPEHKSVVCSKPCKKKCNDCHKVTCQNPCYMPCTPCPLLKQTRIPRCGHTIDIECQEDSQFARCKQKCETILPCGHACSGLCGESHPPCKELVDVTKPCGHNIKVECAVKDTASCNEPCTSILACEHRCQGACGTCFHGRLHYPCTAACTKILICGHRCESSCSSCPPCSKPCENRCNHSKCQKLCGEPCAICMEDCQWRCRHSKCQTPCGDKCDRQRCKSACSLELTCEHPCIGICGEPCPKLCRVCNAEEVNEVFFGTEGEPHARFIQLEDCGHVFEVNGLDQYMSASKEGDNEEEEEKTVVKLMECPKCKTPIRRNLCYGDTVKQALADIEKVKLKVRGNEERIRKLKDSLRKNLDRLKTVERERVQQLLDSVPVPSETVLVAQKNQVSIFKQLIGIERTINDSYRKFKSKDTFKPILAIVQAFKKWSLLHRVSFSEQEVEDAKREMERVSMLKYLLDAKEWIEQDKHDVPVRIMRNLIAIIRRLEAPPLMSEEEIKDAKQMKENVTEYVPGSGIGISDEERLMIVEAIGLNKGHWYKCKRGHVYAIGECGRAEEKSTCPECGEEIGGESHRLTGGNAWAPEMDDAEEPVWSQERDYLMALQLQFGGR